jgi:tetratricopeptide (TPR) repeat protein
MMPFLAACATPETASGPVAFADVEQRDKMLVVADAAYEGGRYSEALAEYTRLLEIDPRDEAARVGVADCYLAAGDAKQALSAIYATLARSETPKIRLGAEAGSGLESADAGRSRCGPFPAARRCERGAIAWCVYRRKLNGRYDRI